MPKYTRKEFYTLCGVSKAYLANYIKRGAVVEIDRLIDTSVPQNIVFMERRVGGVKKVGVPKHPNPPPPPKKQAPIKKEALPKREVQPKKEAPLFTPAQIRARESAAEQEAAAATERFNLDRQIKETELEKKEEEVKKLKTQNAKLSGDVIPTELVRVIFSQHFKSVTTAFHQGCDNFISTIAKQTDMTKEQSASLRGDLIEVVNQAVREGIESSGESVENIVNEYAQVRGRGEKK